MLNGKVLIIHLIVGLIKKTLYKISQYFPPYRTFSGNAKIELDLFGYATKTNLKNVIHGNVSNFAIK